MRERVEGFGLAVLLAAYAASRLCQFLYHLPIKTKEVEHMGGTFIETALAVSGNP